MQAPLVLFLVCAGCDPVTVDVDPPKGAGGIETGGGETGGETGGGETGGDEAGGGETGGGETGGGETGGGETGGGETGGETGGGETGGEPVPHTFVGTAHFKLDLADDAGSYPCNGDVSADWDGAAVLTGAASCENHGNGMAVEATLSATVTDGVVTGTLSYTFWGTPGEGELSGTVGADALALTMEDEGDWWWMEATLDGT